MSLRLLRASRAYACVQPHTCARPPLPSTFSTRSHLTLTAHPALPKTFARRGQAAAATGTRAAGKRMQELRKVLVAMGMGGIALYMYNHSGVVVWAAAGDQGEGDDAEKKKDEFINGLLDLYWPFVEQYGFGGVAGVCAGYALKRISIEMAGAVGVLFIILQGLSYFGYIDVKWRKVQDDAKNLLDADGDGRLTRNDIVVLWRKFMDVMKFNMPGAGGFLSGFAVGFYSG